MNTFGLTRRRLRGWLVGLFLALAVPSALLIREAYSQLQWQAFHQAQTQARALAERIDSEAARLIAAEDARSFADYGFLVAADEVSANLVQRSPLAAYPVNAAIPGLMGYFQVDAQGRFSTPLLPGTESEPGVVVPELDQRRELASRLQAVLVDNQLIRLRPFLADDALDQEEQTQISEADEAKIELSSSLGHSMRQDAGAGPAEAQAAFDQLNMAPPPLASPSVSERVAAAAPPAASKAETTGAAEPSREKRREQVRAVAPVAPAPEPQLAEAAVPPIRTFESEVDPLEFSRLNSGHFVLFRNVWRDGQRLIQGALIQPGPFFEGLVDASFSAAGVAALTDVTVLYRGGPVGGFDGAGGGAYRAQSLSDAASLTGTLLYQSRLSSPLSDLELRFTLNRLPTAPGAQLVTWLALALGVVLVAGFLGLYRLGSRQITLTEQQQDFVSAVSHELKTPLTAIRMYAEMLTAGWASEEKRQGYYRFIHDESERLSRLIGNVLQLARMTRRELVVEVRPLTVGELMDLTRSKVSSQLDAAGFEHDIVLDEAVAARQVMADPDAFSQIVINLVDNAIKFSARAPVKRVEIRAHLASSGRVVIGVRDFGPGIPRDQMKKIFQLFYRSENELTRDTVGTGIGLALVSQLAAAMGGRVDVINRSPGAEFVVELSGQN